MLKKSVYRVYLPRWVLRAGALLLVMMLPVCVWAEYYIYTGPQGEKIISDKPMNKSGYRLQHQRQDIKYAGHLAAGRDQHVRNLETGFFDHYIVTASKKHRVDPALIKAVIRAESNFDPFAISHKGARGLMQLMPTTAAQYQVYDLFSPVANIDVGVRHLAYLLELYENDRKLALAAYNAGERNVEKYRGIPPFRETQNYVKKVIKFQQQYAAFF